MKHTKKLYQNINFSKKIQQLLQKRIVLFVSLFVLAILGLLFTFQSLLKPSTSAAWWNGDWRYRKAIDITNNTTAENNVYTSHSIDTSDTTRFQGDCGGIRFTHQTGKLLKYYIVSGCGTGTTVIHVLHETLAAGRQSIFMYYGNLSVDNGFEGADFSTQASNYAISATGSEETTPGPIAYWKLDEGQGQIVNDSTTYNNDGTVGANSSSASDDPVWRQESDCVSGKCLEFDGSNDTGNLGAVKIPTTGSVSLWWKSTEALTIDQPIFVTRASNSQLFDIYTNSGVMYAGWYNSADKRVAWTMSGINQGQWVNIQLTWTNGGTTTLYINGVSKGTTSSLNTTWDTSTASLRLGHSTTGAGGASFGKVMIDEVKIYPYARSASEVKQDYSSTATALGLTDQKDFLSDGLVGYWKMDEASANTCTGGANDACDSSGNSNDGAWQGNATNGVGKFGAGVSLDGTDDYISLANESNFDFERTSAFSTCSWIYPTSLAAAQSTIVSKMVTAGSFTGWEFHSLTSTLGVYLNNVHNSNQARVSGGTLTTNTWQHVCMTYDGSSSASGIKIYLNGARQTTTTVLDTLSASIVNDVSVTIGSRTAEHELTGRQDEVRIYNRSLSADDVRNLYNWAPSPIGYWNMDEASANTCLGGTNDSCDISGNAKDGTWQGNTASTTGKYGRAISLDGSGDYVDVGNQSLYGFTTGYTLSAWIKRNTTQVSSDSGLISKWDADTGNGYMIRYISNQVYVYINGASRAASSTTIPAETWTYVTATWDGTTVRIYLDGKLDTSASYSTAPTSNSASFLIGRYPSLDFTGSIDEVRAYNYARTSGQIVEDMNAGHPLGGSPIGSQISYWPLDDQQGQTVVDKIAGNNGTRGANSSSSTDDPTWKTKTDCKINGCLSFDSGDYVTMGDLSAADFRTEDFSLSGWFNSSNSGGRNFILSKYTALGVAGRFSLEVGTQGGSGVLRWIVIYDTGVSTNEIVSNRTGLTDGAWHHFAITRTNGNYYMYIDGKFDKSTTANSVDINNNLSFELGALSGSPFYVGKIDEVKIYHGALTLEQVRVDMNAGSAISYSVLGSSEAADLSGGAGNPPIYETNFDTKTGQTVYDISGSSNNGTRGADSSSASDDPTWELVTSPTKNANGLADGTLRFDGSDDYVSIPDNSALNIGTSDFTLEAWVKGNSMANSDIIFGKSNGGGASTSYGYLFGVFDSIYPTLYFATSPTAHTKIQGTTALSNNQWYHIAIVVDRDSSSNTKVYLNGAPITTTVDNLATNTGSITNTVAMAIGSESDTGFNWDGWIDNAKIYNYARSQSQVSYDYNRGVPIAHWKLDECQGDTVYDNSGNGQNGTISVGASGSQTSIGTCVTSSTAWGNGASGKYNSALNFDGTNDTVTISDTNALDLTGDFTIAFWAKYSGSGTYSGILSKKTTNLTQTDGWLIYIATSLGGIIDFVGKGSAGNYFQRVLQSVDTNWHHYAFVMSSGAVTTYYDGVAKSPSTPYNQGALTAGTDSVKMGVRDTANSGFASGKMDDVRIYNYALSTAQIKKIMTEGSAVRFGQ